MADRDEKVGEERSSQYDNRDVQVDIQGQGGEVDAYDTVVGERDRTDCRVGEHPFHQRHGRVPSDQSFVDNYINRKTALCDQAEDICEIIPFLKGRSGQACGDIDKMAAATIKMVTDSVEAFAKEEKKVRDAVGQIKYKAKGLEQTATMEKMLSLNAAIEAGRAGKAGVGFGVVADEIGRMANESAAVYQEIQELVKQVEESMERLGE